MRASTLWTRGRDFLRSYWTPAGKQALGNLIGLVTCTGISQACGFGVLLLLTHGLPQGSFGAVIFALNLQSYLVAVGTFGLTTIVVRDLAQHPDRRAETITAYLTIVTVASVLVGVLTAVAAAVVPISADERVMLWCVAAGNVAACLNLNPLFDAAHKQALAAALSVPADVLALGAVAGLYLTHSLTVPLVGFILLGKWVLVAAVQAAVYFQGERPPKPKWSRSRVASQLRSGWPLFASGMLYMIPLQGGVIISRVGEGERGAALYGLASQLALVVLSIGWLYARIVNPHINGPHGLNRAFLVKLVPSSLLVILGLVVAACATAWVLTRWLLPDRYSDALEPSVFLAIGTGGLCIAMISNLYVIRLGLQRTILWNYVMSCGLFGLLVFTSGEMRVRSVSASSCVALGVLAAIAFGIAGWAILNSPKRDRAPA